jgi:hypothetical protein
MSQAECLKVLVTDKQKCGVVNGGHRGRVVSSIENWQLCDGTAWPIDTENMFTSTGGTFEDADVSGIDDIQSRARLALAKNGFARRKTARHCSLGQESEFGFREPREDLDLRQCLSAVNLDFRHGGYCTEAGWRTRTRRVEPCRRIPLSF